MEYVTGATRGVSVCVFFFVTNLYITDFFVPFYKVKYKQGTTGLCTPFLNLTHQILTKTTYKLNGAMVGVSLELRWYGTLFLCVPGVVVFRDQTEGRPVT